MPLHQLAVNPQDVSGKALRLVLNAAPPAPLAAEPDGDGWRWQTWHLYPGVPAGSGGIVVHTASRWQP
ncbi:hypothetical protein BN971_03614 [Mycobacterium bohemicum DSM 44277]|uniref:Uncharacterized protein n=1 Tax=Mycobacterium bohemicum DSM 44277 TaxID=1236609 RepID=A0A0U0WBC3_MYCBE|nr:DUF2617 family protein [Mycobacterium bohemicum]CPR12320.1 hypothetical protein BN971_03614 [Mycobacterium bohemicum DSM 44277]